MSEYVSYNEKENLDKFSMRKNLFNEGLAKEFEEKDKEIERLKNIIYTTLEYVDREEVNSIGTPYTYTEIGKNIKELLEGERTFNSIWEENKRLNNIINKALALTQKIIDAGWDYDEIGYLVIDLEKLLKEGK